MSLQQKILYIFQGLCIAIALTVTTYMALQIGGFGDRILSVDDGIRHQAYTQIMITHGVEKAQEMYSRADLLPYTIFQEYDTDLWKGYHMVLFGLHRVGFEGLSGLKAFCAGMIGLFFLLLWYIAYDKRIPLGYIALCFVPIVLDQGLMFRVLLARPYILSVWLYALCVYGLYTRRIWLVGVSVLLATYFHAIFWVFLLPIGLYLLVHLRDWRQGLRIVAVTIASIIGGALLHGQGLAYMQLSFIQIAIVPLLHRMHGVMASELQSSLGSIVKNAISIFAIGVFGYGFFQQIHLWGSDVWQKNKHMIFLFVHVVVLMFLIGYVGRFGDFLVISVYLWAVIMVAKIYTDGGRNWLTIYRKKTYTLGIVAVSVLIAGIHARGIYMEHGVVITDDMKFLLQAGANMPTGSVVASYNLLDIPRLLYAWRENYTYYASMEPYFLYLQDSGLFNTYIDTIYSVFQEPKNAPLDTYILMQQIGTDYLVLLGNYPTYPYHVRELIRYKIEELSTHTGFSVVASSGLNYVWKIQPCLLEQGCTNTQ